MKYPELSGHYALEKTIGCGGFAKVKLATHLLTGEKVAIKIMQKDVLKEDLPRVKQEIEALKSLSHPNICQLYQVIESDTFFFLVMEYCCGGELFDHIVETQRLSEESSRLFFRQIVSAVSYLHEQGYAHRDLKPENILLDQNHNLKLIDFGLCIKPSKGMNTHLYTSCGSPSYAAPELILGEKYLGSQIDIWSLGVMLYALLCGTLPFDDNNIEKLYKRILIGDYEEPNWLSLGSKNLIRTLLQVDANLRITTEKLCSHPWLLKDNRKPVDKQGGPHSIVRNTKCLNIMATYLKTTAEKVWQMVSQKLYDYNTATYLLLLQRANAGLPLRILNAPPAVAMQKVAEIEDSPKCRSESMVDNVKETYIVLRGREILSRDENRFTQPKTRRAVKRIRSPGLEDKLQPAAKRLNRTPSVSPNYEKCSTPSSARKVLEGIEKGFNLARKVLTPRRRRNSKTPAAQPVVLNRKNLHNVSSTSSTCPDDVLAQLQQALTARGIICTQKGYLLRGKLKQSQTKAGTPVKGSWKLSFELEVCWLPEPGKKPSLAGSVVGIRRKRLKGDSWVYKNICEEVLALAAPKQPVPLYV